MVERLETLRVPRVRSEMEIAEMEEGVDHEGITPAFGTAWWSSAKRRDGARHS